MPSNPPVTEEMVATFRLGPDPFGRGKLTLFYGKDNYVWLENLPGFVEAAQAVAPPKADALEAVRATLTEIADDFESGVAVMPHDVAVAVARLIREWRDHERPSSPAAPATPTSTDAPEKETSHG